MRTEAPVFKRCCFCLPLRRSLIAWGYFKLFIAAILLLYCLVLAYQLILHFSYRVKIQEIITITVLLALVIVDIILHILFIVGAHKKEVTFLRVYYYYSLTLLVLVLLIDLYWVYTTIQYQLFQYIGTLMLSFWALMFLDLFIQAYVILLVRSEIVKLNDVGSFRFVNNAAEAECQLYIEHPREENVEIDDKNEKDENDKSNTNTEDNNKNIA